MTKYAILIGIGRQYHDNLGSDNDAQLMSQVLQKDYGFLKGNVKLLLNNKATWKNILDAVNWLKANETEQDTFAFLFSGHSGTISISAWDTSIAYQQFQAWFSTLKNKKTFICFQGCYSGSAIPFMASPNRIVVTSTTADSPVADGGKYSVFGTYFIYDAMYKHLGDANKDGKVSIQEAYNYQKMGLMDDQYGQEMIL